MCSGEALSSGDEGFVAMALGRLQSSYSLPPHARAQRGERSFSDPQCENLVGFLQGKLRKVPSPRDLSLLDSSTPLLPLLLSRFSRVRLCATPQTAARQAPPSLGFSRQEHRSGLPFPSPMHESEK